MKEGFNMHAPNNPVWVKTVPFPRPTKRSLWRCRFLFSAVALACFALSPAARAQLSPPPDGGYPNQNTAEGDQALFSLATGINNTANGAQALYSNTTGDNNTATGVAALSQNTSGYNNTAIGVKALVSNTTGNENTATGFKALVSNTTGGG